MNSEFNQNENNVSTLYFCPKRRFGQYLLRKSTIEVDNQKSITKINKYNKLQIAPGSKEILCYANYFGKCGKASQSFQFLEGVSYVAQYTSPLIVFMSGKLNIHSADIDIEEKLIKKQKKKRNIRFGIILAIVLMIVGIMISNNGSDDYQQNAASVEMNNQESNAETVDNSQSAVADTADDIPATDVISEENYEQYEWISYDDLCRTPTDYVGRKLTYEGRVVQIISESSDRVLFSLDISYDVNDYETEMIIVEYERKDVNESRFLEDDIVTVYGNFVGLEEYTRSINDTVVLNPTLEASRIDYYDPRGSAKADTYAE